MHSPTGHELNVGRTFALSYERLDGAQRVDHLAQQLLTRAAHFAWGEPIPRTLLLATLEVGNDEEALLAAEDGLRRLVALGLAEEEAAGSVVFHRLVAMFAQGLEGSEAAQAAVERVLLEQAQYLNRQGYPAPLLAWQSHLRTVVGRVMQREDAHAASLCNTLGYHLQMVGEYAAARPYYERALAIRKQVLGSDHPTTTTSLGNLGALLYAMGDYAAARPYLVRALAVCEELLGPEHPAVATSLNNLGMLLYAVGEYAAARLDLERALAIREQLLGPEHPATATSLNNLGLLLYTMGEYAAARPYYERALAIYEQTLGPQHPSTCTVRSNLTTLENS
jgi:tetratricopeptide (TPR) repeat protein